MCSLDQFDSCLYCSNEHLCWLLIESPHKIIVNKSYIAQLSFTIVATYVQLMICGVYENRQCIVVA